MSAFLMSFAASLGTFAGDFTQHSLIFLHFVALMSPLRHHPLILSPQQSSLVFLFRDSSWWKPALCSSWVHLLSLVFHITQLSFSRRASSESCLSSLSIVSHRKTVFKSCVPHQHSFPLESEGKKADAVTAGRTYTLSIYHSRWMTRRRCLVGEKTFASSRLSWVLHEAWIFASVFGVGPQTFRRWFHVPLIIVHPVLDDCVMVVRPSWVTTRDPSIFSCHSSDFCWSWTHPKSFSPFGHAWLRIPSWSSCIFVILVLHCHLPCLNFFFFPSFCCFFLFYLSFSL